MLNPTGIKKWFVPQKDPKELVRKWQSSLRSESRAIEKQIRGKLNLSILKETNAL